MSASRDSIRGIVAIGSKAPCFTLPSAGGGSISLGDYRNEKCVVLVFLRGFL